MAAFSIIAATTAAVVGAGASVYGAVKGAKEQKRAAAAQEEQAELAQQNADEQAKLIEKVGEYNVKETRGDAEVVKERTQLLLRELDRSRNYEEKGYEAAILQGMRRSAYEADRIRDERDLSLRILDIRGDGARNDATEEIGRIRGQTDYERGALSREGLRVLEEASLAAQAAHQKTLRDAGDMEIAAADADAGQQAALRRADYTLAATLAEEQRSRRRRSQSLGAIAAGTAAAGLALGGSALDVLADEAAASEREIVLARHRGLIEADAYVEDARGAGVRATRLRRDAGFARHLGQMEIAGIEAEAAYRSAELQKRADFVGSDAALRVATIERQRDERLTEIAAERGHRDAQGGADAAEVEADAAARIAALNAEWRYTGDQHAVLRDTTRRDGEAQEAALRREADHVEWRTEIEAENMRLYGQAQAADLLARSSMMRSQAQQTLVGGLGNAAATLLGTGAKVYDRMFPATGSSATTTRTVTLAR